ncbi:hypothetical protein PIB30_015813 [Stylosanthes scabra]|uniref:F-box domain-containing protein n=1 Tax=Stylosanthes scabra TaxID=79078 RepID=A0ABU6Q7S3_9FABA|nr:hypothetical protein [Stylosanthes scabra]
MHPNKSNTPPASLKSLKMSLRALIHELREKKRLLLTKEALPNDVLWMIFVNAEPKLTARCRTFNKKWCSMLNSQLFIAENYKANTTRQKDVIVGIGYSPADLKSQWFCRLTPSLNAKLNEADKPSISLNLRCATWMCFPSISLEVIGGNDWPVDRGTWSPRIIYLSRVENRSDQSSASQISSYRRLGLR